MPISRFILLLMCLKTMAFADTVRLRMGTLGIPPYGFIDQTGKANGAFYALANRLARDSGFAYDNNIYPTARLYAMLERRQLDLAITSLSVDSTMGMIDIGTVWRVEGVILYRKQLAFSPRDVNDFKPYLIGRLSGSCPPLARAGLKLYDLRNYEQGLRMIAAGRLDGLCGEMGGLRPALKSEAQGADRLAAPFVFVSADVHIFANPSLAKSEIDRLRSTLAELNRTGEVSRIISPFVGVSLSKATKSP